jgi:hypothetical protein
MIQNQENSHPNHKRSSSLEHDQGCSKQPKSDSTPSKQNTQEEFHPTPAQVQTTRDLLLEPFELPDLNGQLPTAAQIQEAKDLTYHFIKAKVFTSPNPNNHTRLLDHMSKAIQRMARNLLLYLFSGKCPVPERRGGWSFNNLPPDFEPASNDSKKL